MQKTTGGSGAEAPAKFVEMDAVALRYGGPEGTLALDGTTLGVARGEFAAVVGPSGCGKSSPKLVTGLLPCTGGSIRVAGAEVDGPLKIVGMAFQNPTLLPWRNTLLNTMLPLEIVRPHRHRLRQFKDKYVAQAKELLAAVGLAGFEDMQPWMLSGVGMQQRASLCRALIHDPQLLMLDEPFGALDAFTREELWGVLQKLWLDRKFTCVLVTHDLREAAYLADVIFVMSARPGRIVATHRVALPRPRTVESTFEKSFIDLVHAIRTEISRVRDEASLAARAQAV
jgi:NitT/TauT family transport system ATP-binding protein